MKNKGFTLVEVMAIVIIIAAIALVSFPVLTNVVKNNEKIEEDTFKESAIEAAKTYCNLNKSYDEEGKCSVTISKLIDESYLDKPTIKDYDYKQAVVDCKDGCTYFKSRSYAIGDEVLFHGVKYYSIENSDEDSDSVLLLKAEPFMYEEILKYGNSRYCNLDVRNNNGYGYMIYYCGAGCNNINGWNYTNGCVGYEKSFVKPVIDKWSESNFNDAELKSKPSLPSEQYFRKKGLVPSLYTNGRCNYSFLYDSNYSYFLYTSGSEVKFISYDGTLNWCRYNATSCPSRYVYWSSRAVRPVVNVYKFALENNS
jgi:Tfp pilus assembly protein PilE